MAYTNPYRPPTQNPQTGRHAHDKSAERGISDEAIQAVVAHGRMIPRSQGRHYVITRIEVLNERRWGIKLQAYQDLHVLVSEDGIVQHAYRESVPVARRDLHRPRGHDRRNRRNWRSWRQRRWLKSSS